MKKPGGSKRDVIGRREHLDGVLHLPLQGIVPRIAMEIQAEAGAGSRRAKIDGDHRVLLRTPESAVFIRRPAGEAWADDAVGQLFTIRITGFPSRLGGD